MVNDGSPDTPLLEQALLPYRDRILYLIQKNRGLSGARNTGIRAASGALIALLDGDDLWLPNYLEVQTGFLSEHPEYDVVYCNAEFFGDSPEAGIIYMNLCPSRGEADFEALVRRDCHVFVSVTARREALEAVGPFDESLRSCEDFDLWLRLTAAGHRIGYHPKILVHYRKHRESLSANPIRMGEYSVTVLTNALARCLPGTPRATMVASALAKRQAEVQLLRCKRALIDRNTVDALGFLSSANLYYRSAKLQVIMLLLRFMPEVVRSFYLVRSRTIFRGREAQL